MNGTSADLNTLMLIKSYGDAGRYKMRTEQLALKNILISVYQHTVPGDPHHSTVKERSSAACSNDAAGLMFPLLLSSASLLQDPLFTHVSFCFLSFRVFESRTNWICARDDQSSFSIRLHSALLN